MICKKCGASLPEDCRFCIVCGANLKEQQEPAPAAVPAEDVSAGVGSEFGKVPAAPDFMQENAAPAAPAAAEPKLDLPADEIPTPELVLPHVEADPVEGVPDEKPEIDLILPDTLEELKNVTEDAVEPAAVQTPSQPEAPVAQETAAKAAAQPEATSAPESPAQPEKPAQPAETAAPEEPVRPRPAYTWDAGKVSYQAADPEEEHQPKAQPQQPRVTPIYARGTENSAPRSTAAKPSRLQQSEQSGEVLSMWQWLLCIVLAMIPIVNIVMLCIWGFGSETNPNKRNWARAMLISMAIGIVLAILSFVINMFIFASLMF